MYQTLTPFETQSVEQDRKHLEMVILLIANHINHLIDRIIGKTLLCSTDILRHVDRSTI